MATSMSSTHNSIGSSLPRDNELELHRRILESILTSQLQIIELLQRK